MDLYCVNNKAQSNGDHEVHKDGCRWMPSDHKYLGVFDSCWEAVAEARKTYGRSDACRYCCPEYHTT